MSAALKRRFNFETVPPIPTLEREVALVHRQATNVVERVGEIAGQLREIESRLEQSPSAGVEMSLLERAAELADEAVGLLERVGRAEPGRGVE
jgi:hypothetical protein